MFDAGPRRSRPQGRFNLLVGLAVAAVTGVAYVLALSARTLPNPPVAAVLFTLSPVMCLVAVVVYRSRARAVGDAALRWAASGLTVCFVALTLQFISFPMVAADGGVLATGVQSSAALYLLFHVALVGGALAGGLRAPTRWCPPATWAGCAVALAVALDLVPLPRLIDEEVVFTPLLTVIESVLTGVGVVAAVVWSVHAGRRTTPLAGWFGIAIAVSAADVLLNTLTAERYDAVWWSSLSMRVATFALLAVGSLGHLLREMRRVEGYADAELSRRERQLMSTGEVTDALMENAVALSRASTPLEVADILAESVTRLTGCGRVVVLEAGMRRNGLVSLTHRGYDELSIPALDSVSTQSGSPAWHIAHGGESVYLSGRAEVLERFPVLSGVPAQHNVSRLAAVRLEAAGTVRGAVVVSDDVTRTWSDKDRAVLEALVAQGGPALARAREHAQEHQAVEVLQRSLLPSELRVPPGLSIAARYVPGDSHVRVGGDWYDCLSLPDGRVVLTVGDVMGKGVQAATVMGVLRQSVRVLAALDPSPAAVLTRLDEIGIELGDRAFATVVYVLWDPATRTATVARAGHLPPLLIGPDGRASTVEGALSTPVGLRLGPRTESAVEVPPGSHLLLYTDGLVESRGTRLRDGIQEVLATARAGVMAGQTLDQIAESLLTMSAREDDVALLVIQFGDVVVRTEPRPTRRRSAPLPQKAPATAPTPLG